MFLLQAIELLADKASKRQIPLDLQAPSRFQRIAMERGLAVYCRRTSGGHFGDWAMVSPPLTVTTEQIDDIASGLEQALGAYERELGTQGVRG